MTRKQILSVLLAMLLVGALAAIAFRPQTDRTLTLPGIVPNVAGFQPFPTPRSFDGPGTVIRIEGNTMTFVLDLALDVIDAGKETLPVTESARNWGAEAGASGIWKDLTANLNGATESKYSFELQGGRRFRVNEGVLDAALAETTFNWDRGGDLYVIRETIAAEAIRIEFSQTISGEVGGRVGEQVSGRNYALSADSSSFNVAFPEPTNIFFLADFISKPTGLVATGVERLPGLTPLPWEVEIRNDD